MSDLSKLDGLYVGSLTDDELKLFNAAEKDGRAERAYIGTAGLLGVAKVRVFADHDDSSRGE